MTNKENLVEAIRIASAISMNSSMEDLDVAEDALGDIIKFACDIVDRLADEIYAAREIRKNG